MTDKVNRKLLRFSGICAVVLVISLLVIGFCELLVLGMKGKIDYIRAGERWSSDGEQFAVITAYTEQNCAVSRDEVLNWSVSADANLLSASVSPRDNARSWAYCYGLETTLAAKGTAGSTSAQTLAVGGDFFVFHPLNFIYGSPFLNDDSITSCIVIDKELAWKLFGAVNICGMEVEINDIDFVVTGVVDFEKDDSVYRYTYGTSPRMYISYTGYMRLTGDNPVITMFEAALPNRVDGFGKNIFDSSVYLNESTTSVIEASERFSLKNRFSNMKKLRYAWIETTNIEVPYWENEARVYDYRCARMIIIEIVFAALAGVSLLLSIITLRFSGWSVIPYIKAGMEKSDKRRRQKINRQRKSKKLKERGNTNES